MNNIIKLYLLVLVDTYNRLLIYKLGKVYKTIYDFILQRWYIMIIVASGQ